MTHPTFLGSNIGLVKAHNLRAILLTLLYQGQVSRVELARRTSLSSTTITNLVTELVQQGIVVEEGAQTNREPRVGRPRTALELVPNARYAVGVHIGVGSVRIAITNLCAEILGESRSEFDIKSPPADVLKIIAAQVQQVIDISGVNRLRILGVGVGASGLVDRQNGINVLAPRLGWKNFPLQTGLEGHLKLPIVIDNNVRAMALGEALFGAGQSANVLAFVYGQVGVGAGFVVNGEIYYGSAAGAGEIGHIALITEGGEKCSCGNTGCLETLISAPALIRQADRIAAENPDSGLEKWSHENDHEPVERIFSAAKSGNQAARGLLAQRARYLGLALANLVNVLNPELILLGGIYDQGSEYFLPVADSTMRQYAFAGMGREVQLQVTRFGQKAGVIGAAALALNTFFYQQAEISAKGDIQ